MRKSGFFPRLALVNLARNRQYYLPYFLSCGGAAAMFYMLCFITWNDMIDAMPGGDVLQVILYLGCVVVAIFSAVILLYANSFVMKRRQRELGLYNILGLEKRHIAHVMLWETGMTGGVCIAGGLAAGVLLSKLLLLLLCKLVRFPVRMGFSVSGMGLGVTAGLFAGLFLLALASNLFRLARAKPIELLHSANVGEREPKTKWVLTLVGAAALAAGYGIAIVVKNPVDALGLFFVAVLLVMLGTYCLFTAGSIVLLKRLRSNPGFYYQTRHFTAVSGLLYRMKQNAVGLANICILATMVLVTLSTTVCLYLGSEDILAKMYPADVTVEQRLEKGKPVDTAALRAAVEAGAARSGRTVELLQDYVTASLFLERRDEGGFQFPEAGPYLSNLRYAQLSFLTADDFTRLTGEPVALAADELLVYSEAEALPEEIFLVDSAWKITGRLDSWPLRAGRVDALTDVYRLVTADDASLQRLAALQEASGSTRAYPVAYNVFLDTDGTDDQKKACAEAVQAALGEEIAAQGLEAEPNVQARAGFAYEYYSLYGGFLFLGLFLGVLFLMTTVLIIYYKQISEGYEDRRRFEIMQQVGMSAREVRASIQSQILLVFFLPLGTAAIHILVAFPMICRLLRLFSLTNTALFAWCTLGAVAAFSGIYALVYGLTARAYYKIVQAA